MMFWDMLVLSGYLGLNAVIARTTLESERRAVPPPAWMKPLVLLSIPWAVGIHTVTAFLYSGLAARPFWMTAILAPRFLASAFASGPALLILICLVLKRVSRFDAGKEAVERLAVTAAYAMATNVFFASVELFTASYSAIPEHREAFQYLFLGLDGHARLVPWIWSAEALAVAALVLLIRPATRRREGTLAVACAAVFASIWIEKGLGMVVTAFVPSPLGRLTEYFPTLPEALIALGIYAFGAAVVTVLARIALSVRGQLEA
jgi:Ni/Fe-hydrogenase subunit HybB-like protein